jgi:hypothetical protein
MSQIFLLTTIIVVSSFAYGISLPSQNKIVKPAEDVSASSRLPIQSGVLTDEDLFRIENVATGRKESRTNPLPDIPNIHLKKKDIYELAKDFDLVAIVNKAPDVQTMIVYRFKNVGETRYAQSPVSFPISTGLERWICDPVRDKTTNEVIRRDQVWTGTPTGFYIPYWLHPDHHSGLYHDADMFKANFLIKNLGIATHQAPSKEMWKLGKQRASHGCIRMSSDGSEKIFKWVLESGGPVDINSSDFQGICPAQVQKTDEALATCKDNASKRGEIWKAMVQAAIDEGWADGYGPYNSVPKVPDLEADGSAKKDASGHAVLREGYRSLFVIECVDSNGRDCSTVEIPAPLDCNDMSSTDSSPNQFQDQPTSRSQSPPYYDIPGRRPMVQPQQRERMYEGGPYDYYQGYRYY